MRIISGSLHNREIKIPPNATMRPTSSKLRGQVFNICQGYLEDGYALDLFAGSGAMGIEAISRGATHCTFVEHDHLAVTTLRTNLQSLNLEQSTRILETNVERALQTSLLTSPPFSFVYIDPPYILVEPLLGILSTIDLRLPLKQGAFVFLETRKKAYTNQPLATLRLVSQRSSGDSDLWHFEKM